MNVKDCFPPLIDKIIGLFPAAKAIRRTVRAGDILLTAKVLSPLGIIIELISNSMKYAFKEIADGKIDVSIR